MLLRKRPRPPMRRTTSMTEFSAEAETPGPADPAGADSQSHRAHLHKQQRSERRETADASDAAAEPWRPVQGGLPGVERLEAGYHSAGAASPGARGGGGRRRNSGDSKVAETAPFLMACGLCKRRLGPGRDTFMYRGDTAFCSFECRQQHINQIELKEKCSLTSMKDTSQASTASEKPDNGETAAAA